MIDKIKFKDSVLSNFDFLIEDYKFEYVECKDTGREIIILFKKNRLIVQIKFNNPNHFFDINLFYDSKMETENYYYWENIDIYWLITKYDSAQGIEVRKKTNLSLDETISYKASMLKKYGNEILSEKKWFSWIEVSGWGKK